MTWSRSLERITRCVVVMVAVIVACVQLLPWTLTLSVPSGQTLTLSHWPYASNYVTLCTTIASVFKCGEDTRAVSTCCVVSFQNKHPSSQEVRFGQNINVSFLFLQGTQTAASWTVKVIVCLIHIHIVWTNIISLCAMSFALMVLFRCSVSCHWHWPTVSIWWWEYGRVGEVYICVCIYIMYSGSLHRRWSPLYHDKEWRSQRRYYDAKVIPPL